MVLENIIDQVIAGIILLLFSSILTFFVNKFFLKKVEGKSINGEKLTIKPILISIFITILVAIIGILNFVFSLTSLNSFYFVMAAAFLFFIDIWIYENQCPNCNNIFSIELVNREILSEEKRPYHYRDLTIYRYSDGSVKDKIQKGPEKIKLETWRIGKEYYKCNSCKHEWNLPFERNLDSGNRPKPNDITTKVRAPRD